MSYMPLITPQGTFPDVGLLHAIKLFRLGAAGGGGGKEVQFRIHGAWLMIIAIRYRLNPIH